MGCPFTELQTGLSRANLGRRSGTHLDVLQSSPGCVTFTAYWIPSGDIKQVTSTYRQEFKGEVLPAGIIVGIWIIFRAEAA